MPLPWKKKTQVTRISQIVADLQSPKRGGSLVVQTGFPTSLIDLFVKNRSRFSRPKHKKPTRPEISDPPPPPPSPASSPPPQIPADPRPPFSLSREKVDGGVDLGRGRVRECASGSVFGYRVVGVVFRVLVVVVLSASMKSLTIGITVSAFVLLFLDYAAKDAVSCTVPCCNVAVESLAQKAYACVRFQNLLLHRNKPKKEESELGNIQGKAELRSGSSLLDEIEVVETECVDSSSAIRPELGQVGGDMKWECPGMVEEEDDGDNSSSKVVVEASASRVRRSSFGFKSKMVKKLVPKKFRGSKKSWSEDKSTSFENEDEVRNVGKQDDDSDEVDVGITGSEESSSSLVKEDEAEGNEGQGKAGAGNSGYTILVVITLVGLIVGRLQALILIMAWCFMLKIVKLLWRSRSHDVLRL